MCRFGRWVFSLSVRSPLGKTHFAFYSLDTYYYFLRKLWKYWTRARYAWHFPTLARGWPNEKWLITCVASRRTEPTGSHAETEVKKGTNMTKVNLFVCAANSYLLLTQYRHVFFCVRPWISITFILLRIAFACNTFLPSTKSFSFQRRCSTTVSAVAVATDRVLIFQLNSNAKSSCSAKHTENWNEFTVSCSTKIVLL